MKKRNIAMMALLASGLAGQAQAVTFLTFDTTTARNFNWVRGNSGAPTRVSFFTTNSATANAAGSVGVTVTFADILPNLNALGPLTADLAIQGQVVGNAASIANNVLTQAFAFGSFALTYNGPGFSYNGRSFAAGTNLLAGTYGNGVLSGAHRGRIGTISSSSNVDFTSDVVTFTPQSADGFLLTLPDMSRALAASTGAAVTSYRSKVGGSMSAVIAPAELAVVPEPGTWGMLFAGLGMVGLARRRRRHEFAA